MSSAYGGQYSCCENWNTGPIWGTGYVSSVIPSSACWIW